MRAILLAAGMGTRLQPLTLTTPKPLIEVNGTAMMQRQIEFLKEKGIDEIIVVTGYLEEKFQFLKEKYNVKLVHNDKYNVYNNIYTMYLVKDYLPGSYVMDGDIYLQNNFIDENINKSTYFSGYKEKFKDEWILEFDDNNKVYNINIGSGNGHILCGVSYWSPKDGEHIVKKLEEAINGNSFEDLYWDNMVKDNLKDLDVYIRKINSDDCFEIDSLDDLYSVSEKLKVINEK
ncbi:CTP--phosphocholine cytidylyltransferase [Romboutsia maritimum]|uniref:CTP--phosphocholine cytidylyltransferase n=1 Tax=Romboutsia maritimum TaxID=2020948 RepID=A0A371IX09_9FIRM|nr:sugar phosphate nucleotidyltransferase [Romboutsia maritimum]RDY25007.1 CTP--phosphocholine cytidylyltransferase [Romboutsia maritimum]